MPKNKTAPLTTWQSMVAAKQRTDGRSHGYRCAIRKPPAKAALAYTLRRDVNSKRVRTFIATTSQVALDDGVLLPDGMDSRVFDERPVVLWAHRDEDIGIGRVLARRRTKDPDGWEMDVEFAPADVNSFSDAVLRFMDWSGFGACSIRFNVTDMVRDPKPDDLAKYNLPKYGWLGRAWQLLELSLCNVQADPGALAKAVGEGALARNEASALAAAWRAEGDPEEEAPAE